MHVDTFIQEVIKNLREFEFDVNFRNGKTKVFVYIFEKKNNSTQYYNIMYIYILYITSLSKPSLNKCKTIENDYTIYKK